RLPSTWPSAPPARRAAPSPGSGEPRRPMCRSDGWLARSRRGGRRSRDRTSRDTGRSRPSDLLVDEDEGVPVPQLPRDTPVYRNDRRVTLDRSGQDEPPSRTLKTRAHGAEQGIQVALGQRIRGVGEREGERSVGLAQESESVAL